MRRDRLGLSAPSRARLDLKGGSRARPDLKGRFSGQAVPETVSSGASRSLLVHSGVRAEGTTGPEGTVSGTARLKMDALGRGPTAKGRFSGLAVPEFRNRLTSSGGAEMGHHRHGPVMCDHPAPPLARRPPAGPPRQNSSPGCRSASPSRSPPPIFHWSARCGFTVGLGRENRASWASRDLVFLVRLLSEPQVAKYQKGYFDSGPSCRWVCYKYIY